MLPGAGDISFFKFLQVSLNSSCQFLFSDAEVNILLDVLSVTNSGLSCVSNLEKFWSYFPNDIVVIISFITLLEGF